MFHRWCHVLPWPTSNDWYDWCFLVNFRLNTELIECIQLICQQHFFVIYTSLCWLKYLQCASSNLMIMKLFKKKTLGNCECTLNDLRECRKITTTIYTQINEFNVMQRPCTMCVLERLTWIAYEGMRSVLYDRALHMPLFSINAGQP